jgi:hypothetical protein
MSSKVTVQVLSKLLPLIVNDCAFPAATGNAGFTPLIIGAVNIRRSSSGSQRKQRKSEPRGAGARFRDFFAQCFSGPATHFKKLFTPHLMQLRLHRAYTQ